MSKSYYARPSRQTASYVQRALHPKYVPNPNMGKVYAMKGFGPKRDSLGVRLGLWLDEHNMSAYRLAKLASNIGYKYDVKIQGGEILRWVDGTCVPKSDKMYALSEAMGVSEEWLNGYTHIDNTGIRAVSRPENVITMTWPKGRKAS